MRIKEEEITVLERELANGQRLSLTLSNRGAIVRSIHVNSQLITRDISPGETKPGDKGALFIAPIVFGRIPDRSLVFQGKTYQMPYPEDVAADEVDPDKIYIHGIHHYYTYEEEKKNSNEITYILEKSRLPANYPFPHSTRITYSLTETGLRVTASVFDTVNTTPAQLTLHPFFRYQLENTEGKTSTLQFKGRLKARFDYDSNSPLPMPVTAPTPLQDGGPFTEWTSLDTNLDHSFISEDGITAIRWPGTGPTIQMTDESKIPPSTPNYPVQIWTTGGISRNACAIEQGGPANSFYLVEHGHIPASLLPIIKPGQQTSRVVHYEFS